MLRRIFSFVIIIITVVLGLIFAVLNADLVLFNYFFGKSELPLSLIMVITLAMGALLGVIASMGLILHTKRELAKTRKMTKQKELT